MRMVMLTALCSQSYEYASRKEFQTNWLPINIWTGFRQPGLLYDDVISYRVYYIWSCSNGSITNLGDEVPRALLHYSQCTILTLRFQLDFLFWSSILPHRTLLLLSLHLHCHSENYKGYKWLFLLKPCLCKLNDTGVSYANWYMTKVYTTY